MIYRKNGNNNNIIQIKNVVIKKAVIEDKLAVNVETLKFKPYRNIMFNGKIILYEIKNEATDISANTKLAINKSIFSLNSGASYFNFPN